MKGEEEKTLMDSQEILIAAEVAEEGLGYHKYFERLAQRTSTSKEKSIENDR